jgi:hypothetical protein
MSSVAELRAEAGYIVAHAKVQSNSKLNAYGLVARRLGVSANWLRKFVNDNAEAKEPRWSTGERIRQEYIRLCERVESDAAGRRDRAIEMRKNRNAAAESDPRMDLRVVGRTLRQEREIANGSS